MALTEEDRGELLPSGKQAIFDNRSGKLRPGMYVEAKLAQGGNATAVTLPVSAISYAPFGDSVFIVENVTDPKTHKTLIYDIAIPQDRRVVYALEFLGCCRFGESAALRWRPRIWFM